MLLAEARARGINVEQAVAGYRAIDLFLQDVRRGERPRGGVFVSLLRLLLHYPEVLMWEKMWLDAHRSLYQEIAEAVKWSDPQHQVGYGLWQVINTYNPYLKAQYDQSDYQHTADFLKPVLYHTPAGARFKNFADTWHKSVLADATPEGAYQALAAVLELDEFIAPYADAPLAGFKPAYITRWTQNLDRRHTGQSKSLPRDWRGRGRWRSKQNHHAAGILRGGARCFRRRRAQRAALAQLLRSNARKPCRVWACAARARADRLITRQQLIVFKRCSTLTSATMMRAKGERY
jgi:hypothetical protein